MPTLDEALVDYQDSLRPKPPVRGWLGAFVAGSFQIIVDTDPSLAWVRQEDNTQTVAKHHGRVNLNTSDPDIVIALDIENGELSIIGIGSAEGGAVYQKQPGASVGNHPLNQHTDVDTTGATDGDVLTYNNSTQKWEADTSTSGATDFTDLTDVPGSYSGEGGKLLAVKNDESGVEFVGIPTVASGKSRYVGTKLYQADLTGLSSLTVSDSDLSGTTFADYDQIVGIVLNANTTGTVNLVSAGIYLGAVGGALDTTDANYFTQLTQSVNGNDVHGVEGDANYGIAVPRGVTDDYGATAEFVIRQPADTSRNKTVWSQSSARDAAGRAMVRTASVDWENTAAVGFIGIVPPTDFTRGTLILYGYRTEAVGGAEQSTASFSSPPTDAELTAEFGTVADGFAVDIDSGGAGTAFWHTRRVNGAWVYASMTKAT